MNGYQRVSSALNGKFPDRRPIILHNFMLAAKEAGFTMKQYRESPEIAAKAHIQAVEKYDLDGVFFDMDTVLLASALGVPCDYPENEPARSHEPLLTSLEDIQSLKPVDISKSERIQNTLEVMRIVKRYFGNEKYLRGNIDQAPFSLASMLRTPAEFMMDLLMNGDQVIPLLDYCLEACLQYVGLMAETGVHMVSNGDSPAGPEMISSDMYEQYALPYEKKVVEHAHSKGLKYTLHICGNTDIILEKMLESGADCIELDYKTDINKIHDLYKDKVTLSGNIDPSSVIANGTTALVRSKVKELLELYKDSPRLIVNAGCAIPPTAPEENIFAFVDAVNSFGL